MGDEELDDVAVLLRLADQLDLIGSVLVPARLRLIAERLARIAALRDSLRTTEAEYAKQYGPARMMDAEDLGGWAHWEEFDAILSGDA